MQLRTLATVLGRRPSKNKWQAYGRRIAVDETYTKHVWSFQALPRDRDADLRWVSVLASCPYSYAAALREHLHLRNQCQSQSETRGAMWKIPP